MTVRRAVVAGCGSYLPERVVSNSEIARMVETSDDWIVQRTGIKSRHIAEPNQTTSELALRAGQAALDHAGVRADAVDMIVVATTTPDNTFPATATKVQADLGMTRGFAFDVQAVCSGFMFALATANNAVIVGQADTVLVVGAEIYSRILDWDDRSTCVLFGDGAGSVVLQASEGQGTTADRGILSTHLHSDGRYREMLYVDGGVTTTGTIGHLRMNGREVFKHAVNKLAEVVDEALEYNHLSAHDIDWLVPHQANRRIIDATARKLDLPQEKVVLTVDHHANTSAASIPLALDEAVKDGRIARGDLVLMEAMGGGFTWGSALARW